MEPSNPGPDAAALSLVLAVIASSETPLLLLDGDLNVVAASASFCRAFKIDPPSVAGKRLPELGGGEWNVPQFVSLLEATASGAVAVDRYEMELKLGPADTRLLVLNAHKLDYDDSANVRVILAAADVTEDRAREKRQDDLLREKAILLREVQHRVANSLQIIASVLLQSARRVQSVETRTHLHDAHSRVLSIAAVQQQLAVSNLGSVELRPYLAQLCKSIGASMIHDHAVLSIQVESDDSKTDADVSVSIGLMVTELVINALKHAFPGHRRGKIVVRYHAHAANWTLSVGDNGIGMSHDPASKPGLGTNIVAALAARLGADVRVAASDPGTLVSIVHTQLSLVQAAVQRA